MGFQEKIQLMISKYQESMQISDDGHGYWKKKIFNSDPDRFIISTGSDLGGSLRNSMGPN